MSLQGYAGIFSCTGDCHEWLCHRKIRSHSLGGTEVLKKPFLLNDVEERVKSALNR